MTKSLLLLGFLGLASAAVLKLRDPPEKNKILFGDDGVEIMARCPAQVSAVGETAWVKHSETDEVIGPSHTDVAYQIDVTLQRLDLCVQTSHRSPCAHSGSDFPPRFFCSFTGAANGADLETGPFPANPSVYKIENEPLGILTTLRCSVPSAATHEFALKVLWQDADGVKHEIPFKGVPGGDQLGVNTHEPTASPTAAPTASPTDSPTNSPTKEYGELLLFRGKGDNTAWSHSFPGWYTSGHTVGSGEGKRAAYDTMPCSQFKFAVDCKGSCTDSSAVVDNPNGATSLLSLVQSTGKNHNSQNDNSGNWRNGHLNMNYVSKTGDMFGGTSYMTLIHGDGSADHQDWVTFSFAPSQTTGNGDWDAHRGFALGHEFATEKKYQEITEVWCLYGTPPIAPETLLFQGSGSNTAWSHSFAGWYTSGHTVSSGEGKYAAYDTYICDEFKFEVDCSGSCYSSAVVTNPHGKTSLLSLVQSTGKNHNSQNDNSGNWRNGHLNMYYRSGSKVGSKFGSDNYMTLIHGDGSADHQDWVTFSFTPSQSTGNGDWDAHRGFALGHEFATEKKHEETTRVYGVNCAVV